MRTLGAWIGGKTLCSCILQPAAWCPGRVDAMLGQLVGAPGALFVGGDVHVSGTSARISRLGQFVGSATPPLLGNADSAYGGKRRPWRSRDAPLSDARSAHSPSCADRVRRRRTEIGNAEPDRAFVDDGVQVPIGDAGVDERHFVQGARCVLTGGGGN